MNPLAIALALVGLAAGFSIAAWGAARRRRKIMRHVVPTNPWWGKR
jgi:hypothetical protein